MIYFTADLGGTLIKCGLVKDGSLLAQATLPAVSQHGLGAALPRIGDCLRALCAQRGLSPDMLGGAGIGVPTLVDARAGKILCTLGTKYPDADRVDVPGWFAAEFSLPVKLENDAHAALLGEWRFGAGRGVDDLVMVTLGTGIGTSVLLQGRPLRGVHWQAGNLGGHFVMQPLGRPCGCGGQGCVEAITQKAALVEAARKDVRWQQSLLSSSNEVDYAVIFEAAKRGDKLALSLRNRSLEYWGALLVSLIHAYDPVRVIVGGGIMQSADVILPCLRSYVDCHALTPWGKVQVAAASLGNGAALLGVSVLFMMGADYL